jgi:hypothetical protein
MGLAVAEKAQPERDFNFRGGQPLSSVPIVRNDLQKH